MRQVCRAISDYLQECHAQVWPMLQNRLYHQLNGHEFEQPLGDRGRLWEVVETEESGRIQTLGSQSWTRLSNWTTATSTKSYRFTSKYMICWSHFPVFVDAEHQGEGSVGRNPEPENSLEDFMVLPLCLWGDRACPTACGILVPHPGSSLGPLQ